MAICSFCTKTAVSSYLVRIEKIPVGFNTDSKKHPDKSHMNVVRVCEDHKRQVPR